VEEPPAALSLGVTPLDLGLPSALLELIKAGRRALLEGLVRHRAAESEHARGLARVVRDHVHDVRPLSRAVDALRQRVVRPRRRDVVCRVDWVGMSKASVQEEKEGVPKSWNLNVLAETMMRSPPAAGFSRASWCASAMSRTSTQPAPVVASSLSV
jgi:hypothetical protein